MGVDFDWNHLKEVLLDTFPKGIIEVKKEGIYGRHQLQKCFNLKYLFDVRGREEWDNGERPAKRKVRGKKE
jgi:hypothetical protein